MHGLMAAKPRTGTALGLEQEDHNELLVRAPLVCWVMSHGELSPMGQRRCRAPPAVRHRRTSRGHALAARPRVPCATPPRRPRPCPRRPPPRRPRPRPRRPPPRAVRRAGRGHALIVCPRRRPRPHPRRALAAGVGVLDDDTTMPATVVPEKSKHSAPHVKPRRKGNSFGWMTNGAH